MEDFRGSNLGENSLKLNRIWAHLCASLYCTPTFLLLLCHLMMYYYLSVKLQGGRPEEKGYYSQPSVMDETWKAENIYSSRTSLVYKPVTTALKGHHYFSLCLLKYLRAYFFKNKTLKVQLYVMNDVWLCRVGNLFHWTSCKQKQMCWRGYFSS